jgi:hypothetical protein
MELTDEQIIARRAGAVSELASRGLITVAWRNILTGTLSLEEPPAELGWCPVVVDAQRPPLGTTFETRRR